MSFVDTHGESILKMYEEDNQSPYEIAAHFKTYPNKIRRALKSMGATIRDKSDAQKLAIQTGRTPHPTKGKKRDDETKRKISESTHQYWENMDDKERERRSELAKEQWDNMSKAEKEALHQAAAEAVREAAKNGSKMEKYLESNLIKAGFDVIFHKKGLIVNENLEVDLFISDLNTAIEIDGPAHFLPIWGVDKLNKHLKSDAQKTGLLLSKGYCIIRVKHLRKNISQKHMRDTLNSIVEALEKIRKKFPAKNKRYIELEVK